MKVKELPQTRFKSVGDGEVFRHQGALYIKVAAQPHAVCLQSGSLIPFQDGAEASRVSGTFVEN